MNRASELDNVESSVLQLLATEGRIGQAESHIQWPEIHHMLVTKLDDAIEGMNLRSKYSEDPLTGVTQCLESRGSSIMAILKKKFSDVPPFTVQRLTELIIEPRKYYSKESPEKYLHALEQVLSAGFDTEWNQSSEAHSELQTAINEDEAGHKGITLIQLDW